MRGFVGHKKFSVLPSILYIYNIIPLKYFKWGDGEWHWGESVIRIVFLNDHSGFSVVTCLERASMNTGSLETFRIMGLRDDASLA